jgi:hypothetical protein
LASKISQKRAVASISKVFSRSNQREKRTILQISKKPKLKKKKLSQAQNSLQEKMLEVEEQLKSTKEKLIALEQENSLREAEVRFNSRMEALSEVYDLDDEDLKILASELSQVDESEEGFASYQEKLSKVWKHKNKDFIAAEQKAFEERVAQEVAKRLETVEAAEAENTSKEISQVVEASETEEQDSSDEVEDALENVQVEDAAVINNNESSSEAPSSLRDRFAKTFKESVKISY